MERSEASEKAEKLGLDYVGFGRYAKNGTVVARSEKGRLVPVKKTDKQPSEKSQDQKPQEKERDVEKKPESSKIRLKDLLPKSTIERVPKVGHIRPEYRMKVSAVLSRLKKLTDDAISRGEKAPTYDLCQIHIPGTNLFCQDNLGVPRHIMPQFKGVPEKGSLADKLEKGPNGEVNADDLFREKLDSLGVKVVKANVPADRLKATQNQLVGTKVAGMSHALDKEPKHSKITEPIYVSRDGYVLDGHHRWAAQVARSLKQNNPVWMKAQIIDMDMKDLLPLAVKFAKEIGIKQKGT